MHKKITAQQLKQAVRGDFDGLINEVVAAINQAQAGRIIADSEQQVRQASGLFRRRLYEKALQFRQKQEEPAFSPSGQGAGPEVGE